MPIIRLKPTCKKKSGCEQSGELYSNFLKISSPAQKTTLTTNSAFDNWILIVYATPAVNHRHFCSSKIFGISNKWQVFKAKKFL
jgi:hypothetical protein